MMEDNSLNLRDQEEAVEVAEGVQVACDQCGMIGSMSKFVQGIDDDQGTLHFHVLEMDECGHGFVLAVKDPDLVRPALDKVNKFTKRAVMLQGSGDLSGLERTVRRIEAAKLEVQQKMRLLWKSRAQKVSEWPATPRLDPPDDS